MTVVNMLDAKSTLSRLVDTVESGAEREIIIIRNGKPMAKLVPIGAPVARGPVGHQRDPEQAEADPERHERPDGDRREVGHHRPRADADRDRGQPAPQPGEEGPLVGQAGTAGRIDVLCVHRRNATGRGGPPARPRVVREGWHPVLVPASLADDVADRAIAGAELPLGALVEELESEADTDPKLLAEARQALARTQFYTTWLMRLEGLDRAEWEPEIEAARQNWRLLAEQSNESEAATHRTDLEAAIRLSRIEIEDLQGLPLPGE